MRITLPDLLRMHAEHTPIVMLTCYDASFARALDGAGIDVLLVGDSLGMVVQGHDSPNPVTIGDMAYHTQAVADRRPHGTKRFEPGPQATRAS